MWLIIKSRGYWDFAILLLHISLTCKSFSACFHFVTICMQLLIHYRIRDVTTDPRIWCLLGKPDFGGGICWTQHEPSWKFRFLFPLLSKVPDSTFQERSEHKHIGVVPPLEIDSCLSPEKVNWPKSILYREKARIWKWMLLFNLQQTSWNGTVISCCPAH